jgi:hypothetical protein
MANRASGEWLCRLGIVPGSRFESKADAGHNAQPTQAASYSIMLVTCDLAYTPDVSETSGV